MSFVRDDFAHKKCLFQSINVDESSFTKWFYKNIGRNEIRNALKIKFLLKNPIIIIQGVARKDHLEGDGVLLDQVLHPTKRFCRHF